MTTLFFEKIKALQDKYHLPHLPWKALGLTLVGCLIFSSDVFAVGEETFEVVKKIAPKFTATAESGIKWGSFFGGSALFALGLSKSSMRMAGYGLGLAVIPAGILALAVDGFALMLD